MTTPPPSNRAESLLTAALDHAPEDREAFLAKACGNDAALLAEVRALLAAYEDMPTGFLAEPAVKDIVDSDLDATIRYTPGTMPPISSTETEREGELIGRYKLLQNIGEGGFGTVWMAEQTEPVTRRVALKIIKLGMDTREVIARFEQERQALAMMDHPNIAKVLDAGATDKGRPFFVMELVKGMPITKYCDEAQLGTRERLALFGDVCSAINHAHQKGVIHRDIKPSNVMVTLHGDKPVVKVIDFGIAKATQGKLTDKTLFTRFDQFVGTPVYMSPEQASLSGLDVDTRSDIYALGILLYELLVGKPPFDGKSLLSAGYEEMRRIIREVEPPKPSSRLSTVTVEERSTLAKARQIAPEKLSRLVEPDLDWIVMKAIEKDRTRRYETANAFAQDIVRFLADEPISAGPPSAVYRMRKFARRNRRGLLSGAAAAAALLAGLAVAGGIWLNSTFEKNERVTRALDLIGQAEQRLEQNAATDFDDDRNFREACELERRVEDSLSGIKSLNDAARKRRESLRQAIATEKGARDLVASLEGIMVKNIFTWEKKLDGPSKANALATAFAKFGITPFDGAVADTVDRMKTGREALVGRMLVGLMAWSDALEETNPGQTARLEEIIDRANANPWRRELRQAIKARDAAVLEALVKSDEIAKQPTMTVLQLYSALEEKQLAGALEMLLRRAQREAPASYWTNFILGLTLLGAVDREPGSDVRVKPLFIGESVIGSGLPGASPEKNPKRPQSAEAIGFLRAAAAARPGAETPWIMLGVALSGSGHLDEAVAIYQKAFALNPAAESIHFLLGHALLAQGRHQEALPHLRVNAESDPAGDALTDAWMAQYALGSTLAQLGEYEEARAVFLKFIKQESEKRSAPNATDDPAKVSRQEKMMFMGKETEFTEEIAHLLVGFAQSGRGDAKGALASAQLALDMNPNSALAQMLRGMELMKTGDLQTAKLSFQKASELNPDLAMAHNSLGMSLMQGGDSENAVASIRRAIELDPKDASARCNLGAVLIQMGKLDEATASIKTSLELAPKYAMAWNNLGAIREREGKLDEAMEHYRKAASLDPGDTTKARPNLARTLWRAGKHEESIAACRELNDAAAYREVAVLLADEKRIEEAIAMLQRAIALKPDYVEAHHDLGAFYLRVARYQDAIEPFRNAIRLAPGLASAHNQLGIALVLQGKFDEGIDAIIKALQLEPGSEPFKNALLTALLSSGRITPAGMAHGPCDEASCIFTVMLEKDKQLRKALEKDGLKGAEVPSLLNDIFENFSGSIYSKAVNRDYAEVDLRKIWDGRREEIAGRLASATVRLLQIHKQSDKQPGASEQELRALADGIAKQLVDGGDFAKLAELYSEGQAAGKPQTVEDGELLEELNTAAFTLKEGEFTPKVIELKTAFCLLKVVQRPRGTAENFDDPKVQAAIKRVLAGQWRKDWEQRCLTRLQDKKPDLIMASVQNLAGVEYIKAGAYNRAAELLEQAAAARTAILGAEDSETIAANNNMALAYFYAGRLDEALKLQEEVLKFRRKVSGMEHKETLTAMSNLAMTYAKMGRNEEALKLQEDAVALERRISGPQHPETLRAISNLAVVYSEANRVDEALKLIEEVMKSCSKVKGPEHPETLTVMNNLATIVYKAGRKDEGIKLMEELLPLRRKVSGPNHPDTLMVLHNLADIYSDAGRKEELDKLKQEYGASLLDSGAIAYYDRAIAINPKNGKAYSNRGAARQEKGDVDGAIADYERAIALDPENDTAYSNRGMAKQAKGDVEGALADCDRAIALNPKNDMAYNNRGFARYGKGDVEGAIADYDRAIALNPKNDKAYTNRGFAKEAKGDVEGAIADYDRAIASNPKNDGAYTNRGTTKAGKGDVEGAIADFDRAIVINPKNEGAYTARGMAKQAKGDVEGAMADLSSVIAINPKNDGAYTYRGAVKQAKADLEGALADYDHAIAINPKDWLANNNRGMAKLAKGDVEGAIADFDRAIANNPKRESTYASRVFANTLKRNWKEVLVDWRHICELNEKEQDYPRLFIWLIRARLGETEAAGKELSAFIEKRPNAAPGDWISTVGGHLLGTVTEEKLLAAAAAPDAEEDRGQKCRAWYFAGMKKLLAGDKAAAADYFRKCIATELKNSMTYNLAEAELKALAP